jgi:beta-xylosidase
MIVPRTPIVSANCPDPAAFVDGDDLWLVCTTNDNREPDKFPLRRSRDLTTWTELGHVFPQGTLPSWAVEDFWAPELHRHGNGYICYFTARDTTGMLCLGAARAERIEGPWHDLGQPLLRDATVGMIDAHRYDDGGQAWLLWKADGNAFKPARPTPLFVQRLDADGITLVGERREIMHNDLPWEGDVVEGPWIVKRPDALYLFYAANKFNSEKYATGVARAATIDGEFVKKPEPILTSSSRGVGPGHGCAVTFKGRDLFIYHAWDEGRVDKKWNEPTYPRKAHVDEIHWGADGWPRIGD